MSILVLKTETLYCAYTPEWGLFTFGACRDEALNNLQDELARSAERSEHTSAERSHQ